MNENNRTRSRVALVIAVIFALLSMGVFASSFAVAHPATVPLSKHVKCSAGTNAEFTAYDPVTKAYYVTNPYSSNISVFKGTCAQLGTITLPAGAQPRGIAYNPATNKIYVADYSLNQVYVIVGTHVKQTLTSPALDAPFGIAYDPATGYFFGGGSMVVTNVNNDTITVLSQTSNTGPLIVLASVPVGLAPKEIAYSPVYNYLYVTNSLGDNVTIYDASLLSLVGSVGVGSYPFGIAYDPSSLLVDVTNVNSNNVTMLDGTYIFLSVAVGTNPYGIAFDPANQRMYVSNYGSANISEISAAGSVVKTVSMPHASGPVGLAFDEASNKMICGLFSVNAIEIFS